MSEDPSSPESSPRPRSSGVRTFVGLFVVPLLVVIMCVGVFVLFGWAAYERRSVEDYLSDLRDNRSFFAHRRKQAAYELSKILSANPQALREDPRAGEELRKLFTTSEDLWVRRYLALVLGHVGDREAVPLLITGAADDDSQVRIYSLWALGAIADPAALPTLTAALADTDPGIRKTAAYALGGFVDPAAADALRPLVNDPVADVRWNAALALARQGDGSGTPVLEQMLDRRLLAQIPDITPEQQEDAMISALNALIALGADIDGAILDRLATDDPSYKVRQAAIEARKTRGSGRQGEQRQLLSDRLAGGAAFSTPARWRSPRHRSLECPPPACTPELTPSERFDYIRGFPVCPGSLPQQGRV